MTVLWLWETAVFDSEIDLKDYTCTVASDKETVATAELKDGKIVVTPVSTGTATITATYTKNSGAAEGIALLDEGEATAENDLTATFTVEGLQGIFRRRWRRRFFQQHHLCSFCGGQQERLCFRQPEAR